MAKAILYPPRQPKLPAITSDNIYGCPQQKVYTEFAYAIFLGSVMIYSIDKNNIRLCDILEDAKKQPWMQKCGNSLIYDIYPDLYHKKRVCSIQAYPQTVEFDSNEPLFLFICVLTLSLYNLNASLQLIIPFLYAICYNK